MKKTAFFSILFALLELFGNAQTAPTLIPADIDTTNNVTTNAVIASAYNLSAGSGDFYSAFEYRIHNSNVWMTGDTAFHYSNEATISEGAYGLNSNTLYDVRHKTWNVTRTDSNATAPQTVRTKITAQPLSISFVATLPTLPKSGIIFSASAVGHNSEFAFGLNSLTLAPETDTLWGVTGSTDTVHFLVDGPNFSHPSVRMIIRGDSGMVAFASVTSPPFTTPGNTGPTLAFDSVSKTTNAAVITLHVPSLGNVSGGSVLITKVTNSFGTAVIDTTQPITTTGTVTIPVSHLLSNTVHTGTSRIVNGLGIGDTITYSFKTNNVGAPTVTLTPNAVEDFTSYGFNAFVNSNNTADDSAKVTKLYVYESINLNLIDSATISADTLTKHFNETGKATSSNYLVTVKAVNAAHIVSAPVTVTLHTKSYVTNPAPYVDDMMANSASDLVITGFVFHVGIGNTADCAYVLRDITDNILVDTFYLAHGATNDISFQSSSVTNLTGNHAYSVTPITIGANGIVEGNTLVQVMPAPEEFPIAAGLSQHTTTDPATMLTVNGFGSGEGNQCTVMFHLETINNVPFDTIVAPGTWSSDIDFTASWIHLNQGTTYKVVMDVIAPTGKADQVYAYYTTDGTTTGVQEVQKDETTSAPKGTDMVIPVNVIGQQLAEMGEYTTTYQSLHSQHQGEIILFKKMFDIEKNPLKGTFKTIIQ